MSKLSRLSKSSIFSKSSESRKGSIQINKLDVKKEKKKIDAKQKYLDSIQDRGLQTLKYNTTNVSKYEFPELSKT